MTNKEKCFLAYIAGLIDGEGCINIIKTQRKLETLDGVKSYLSYRAQIAINMADALALAMLKDLFSKSHLYYYRNKTQENRKPIWMWCIYDNNCWDFLKKIQPYLINKQEESRVLLSFIATKRKHHLYRDGLKLSKKYWKRLDRLHSKLMALRQRELNGMNSVELLKNLDLRKYRAKHEDCERLREGVTTMLNKYKAISVPEKEIV